MKNTLSSHASVWRTPLTLVSFCRALVSLSCLCSVCSSVHIVTLPLPCHMSNLLLHDRYWALYGCTSDVTRGHREFDHQSKWHRWGNVLCVSKTGKRLFLLDVSQVISSDTCIVGQFFSRLFFTPHSPRETSPHERETWWVRRRFFTCELCYH